METWLPCAGNNPVWKCGIDRRAFTPKAKRSELMQASWEFKAPLRWKIVAGLFVVFQIGCTISDKNFWPFCSYNMFNQRVPTTLSLLKADLVDEKGNHQEVDVSHLLPLEFFRTKEVIFEA